MKKNWKMMRRTKKMKKNWGEIGIGVRVVMMESSAVRRAGITTKRMR